MTQVPKDEAALVSDIRRNAIDIYLPKKDEGDMPACVVYMMACAMRFTLDQAFVEEQIAWLTSQMGQSRMIQ